MWAGAAIGGVGGEGVDEGGSDVGDGQDDRGGGGEGGGGDRGGDGERGRAVAGEGDSRSAGIVRFGSFGDRSLLLILELAS
eukprot:595044-Prorocentrum_minimum.AAC.1